ncbi:proline--tRNA ligase [Cohnella panacarvi]|uniref:proline--tRNA ligase n=1 Tax=Cohnella panacarvi TaxID=400776 RepID=UPI00047A3E48|nr:proline--tRNA ligase [Cohnella panacarvi]
MRQNTLLAPTLREAPADSEAISHQLLLRAGFIRQLAAGIYTYLPLGWRVLRKLESIVRQEMDAAGAQELLMPAMQPAELWQESGRYDVYGPELIRLSDRHDRAFALGPTHEEVITALVRDEIQSYRKLPVTLYQIQTKYRDERRPRFGLLRGREFLMKDAYSFDTSWEGLNRTYWRMYEAYGAIFARCGLNVRPVEADAGAIGGEGSTHEFMALADIGEDTIASCTHCDYASNLEKARAGDRGAQTSTDRTSVIPQPEKIHTPNIRTINELVAALDIHANELIKTIVALVDGKPVAILVRGDHDVNEIKVRHYFGGAANFEMADADTIERLTGAAVGFLGPIGLDLPILADIAVARMSGGVAGANERDFHLRNVQPLRDIPHAQIGDFRNVAERDPCPRCEEGTLAFNRGIEVGHVFKLGTKYSEKLGAAFLNAEGKRQAAIMGCYGIGVSRMLSAIAEQNHDAGGLVWPLAIAPFHVHLIPVSIKDETQMQAAERLYQELSARGIEVLLDDRDERPGVKFKDADLFGIPMQVVVGKQAGEGLVEFKFRNQTLKNTIPIDEATRRIMEKMNSIG